MSWVFAHIQLGHTVFITFIELKIEGSWRKYEIQSWDKPPRMYQVLASNSEHSYVHIIEPDGLRRILHFTDGGTIRIDQNLLSYKPEHVNEITVDEKEQFGKGKTREKL